MGRNINSPKPLQDSHLLKGFVGGRFTRGKPHEQFIAHSQAGMGATPLSDSPEAKHSTQRKVQSLCDLGLPGREVKR